MKQAVEEASKIVKDHPEVLTTKVDVKSSTLWKEITNESILMKSHYREGSESLPSHWAEILGKVTFTMFYFTLTMKIIMKLYF